MGNIPYTINNTESLATESIGNNGELASFNGAGIQPIYLRVLMPKSDIGAGTYSDTLTFNVSLIE